MALQGTLDAFGVAEVLHLLAATGKTGCLRVEGDGGRGELWLRDGALTAASSDRAAGSPPEEVLCDLLRYRTGSFVFAVDEATAGVGVAHDLDQLLRRADMLLAEWHELEAVVPSLDHRIGLVERLSAGERVTVSARQWPALVVVGRGCTVSDLAAALGLTDLAALRTAHDLVTSGLTTVQPTRFATQRQRVRPARAARTARA